MNIAVVGTGYVGLVTGTCLADMGNSVTCQDIDPKKISILNSGNIPIYEPGLQELVGRNIRDERLFFTTDLEKALSKCDICFIAVGTPPSEDGSADRSYVLAAAKAIAAKMKDELIVVIKSTVPVGTGDMVSNVIQDVLAAREVSYPFQVVSNPEFLKEGKAVQDFMHPDRIVIGTEEAESAQRMQALYGDFVRNGHPLLLMNRRSAEMTKYAANAMLATRISLMNEIAKVCDNVGADIMSVREGIGTDSRIGMSFLYAGIGYGGSCFPKDVRALAQVALESDCNSNLLDAVEQVNRQQKVLLANRILGRFQGNVNGKKFALWGLSFKPNTDDIRESPALAILKRLTDEGALISAYDPEAMSNAKTVLANNPNVYFAQNIYEAVEGADGLVLATEWGAFRNPDFGRITASMKTPIFFDGRNQFEPTKMRALGFEYSGIGRGSNL